MHVLVISLSPLIAKGDLELAHSTFIVTFIVTTVPYPRMFIA